MTVQSDKNRNFLIASIALLASFAVLLQLYLIIINRVASVGETLIRFFSFFTILSNSIVAICFMSLWLQPHSRFGKFFLKPQNATATTLYILIVGMVYNAILRFLWQPTGLQRFVDELLHTVIPILVLVFWIFFVPKKSLAFKNVLQWLIYPFIYLIYIMIRGHYSNYYPYPFMNVGTLGLNEVFKNSFFIMLAFVIVSFLLVFSKKIPPNK